jgi:hypothetical protein
VVLILLLVDIMGKDGRTALCVMVIACDGWLLCCCCVVVVVLLFLLAAFVRGVKGISLEGCLWYISCSDNLVGVYEHVKVWTLIMF